MGWSEKGCISHLCQELLSTQNIPPKVMETEKILIISKIPLPLHWRSLETNGETAYP